MAGTTPELALVDVRSAAAWETWLDANHEATPQGVWLRLFRKGRDESTLTYADAVEIALCFGWIDGQARKLDDVSRQQRFTPRRRRSVWSKVNVGRAERLIEAGRMRPAGMRAIEDARADGRWERAYDPPSTAVVPEDFLAALRESPRAEAFFATFDKRNRFPVSHRLQTASTAATRARRIRAIIEMLERGERFYD